MVSRRLPGGVIGPSESGKSFNQSTAQSAFSRLRYAAVPGDINAQIISDTDIPKQDDIFTFASPVGRNNPPRYALTALDVSGEVNDQNWMISTHRTRHFMVYSVPQVFLTQYLWRSIYSEHTGVHGRCGIFCRPAFRHRQVPKRQVPISSHRGR